MNALPPHTDPAKPRSSIFKTTLRRMRFTNFLEHIQEIPWFTILFFILFSYGMYQTTTRPHSPANTWLKQSILLINQSLRQLSGGIKPKRDISPIEDEAAPIDEEKQTNPKVSTIDPLIYEEKWTTLETRCADLEATIVQLRQIQDTLQKELDNMKSRVAEITQATDAPRAPLPTNVSTDASPADSTEAPISPDATASDYSVHAVIQGRAWLNTKDGKLLTVNVGSQLPNLGTVQEIDAENRLVYFDQGTILEPAITEVG